MESDFSQTPAEQKLADHMEKVAALIEKLYARQRGVYGMEARLPKADTLAAAVFLRNQSPWCAAPQTESNEACTALSPRPKQLSGLYPAALQAEKNFCALLGTLDNSKDLKDHFTTVVAGPGKGNFSALPFPKAFPEMAQVAKELELAAKDLPADEAALKAYLEAAAKAFRTNDWEPAERGLGGDGRRQLQVVPAHRARRGLLRALRRGRRASRCSFARINHDSLAWQKKLEPVKNEMEKALADAGRARRTRRAT